MGINVLYAHLEVATSVGSIWVVQNHPLRSDEPSGGGKPAQRHILALCFLNSLTL